MVVDNGGDRNLLEYDLDGTSGLMVAHAAWQWMEVWVTVMSDVVARTSAPR